MLKDNELALSQNISVSFTATSDASMIPLGWYDLKVATGQFLKKM